MSGLAFRELHKKPLHIRDDANQTVINWEHSWSYICALTTFCWFGGWTELIGAALAGTFFSPAVWLVYPIVWICNIYSGFSIWQMLMMTCSQVSDGVSEYRKGHLGLISALFSFKGAIFPVSLGLGAIAFSWFRYSNIKHELAESAESNSDKRAEADLRANKAARLGLMGLLFVAQAIDKTGDVKSTINAFSSSATAAKQLCDVFDYTMECVDTKPKEPKKPKETLQMDSNTHDSALADDERSSPDISAIEQLFSGSSPSLPHSPEHLPIVGSPSGGSMEFPVDSGARHAAAGGDAIEYELPPTYPGAAHQLGMRPAQVGFFEKWLGPFFNFFTGLRVKIGQYHNILWFSKPLAHEYADIQGAHIHGDFGSVRHRTFAERISRRWELVKAWGRYYQRCLFGNRQTQAATIVSFAAMVGSTIAIIKKVGYFDKPAPPKVAMPAKKVGGERHAVKTKGKVYTTVLESGKPATDAEKVFVPDHILNGENVEESQDHSALGKVHEAFILFHGEVYKILFIADQLPNPSEDCADHEKGEADDYSKASKRSGKAYKRAAYRAVAAHKHGHSKEPGATKGSKQPIGHSGATKSRKSDIVGKKEIIDNMMRKHHISEDEANKRYNEAIDDVVSGRNLSNYTMGLVKLELINLNTLCQVVLLSPHLVYILLRLSAMAKVVLLMPFQ